MLRSRLPVYALSIREFVHAPHPQCVVIPLECLCARHVLYQLLSSQVLTHTCMESHYTDTVQTSPVTHRTASAASFQAH